MKPTSLRKYAAEFLGTQVLVCAICGSGIMATNLTSDVGLQLFINALATIFSLGLLIFVFSEISGSHFNPVVTLAALAQRKISFQDFLLYLFAQFLGGITGAILANSMFSHTAISHSRHIRTEGGYFLSEVVATAGLLFLINILGSQGKGKAAPFVVAGWIGSAYFFTSSTSFANPAVTLARSFTDTFSGISLHSVPMFIFAQVIGAGLGTALVQIFLTSKRER